MRVHQLSRSAKFRRIFLAATVAAGGLAAASAHDVASAVGPPPSTWVALTPGAQPSAYYQQSMAYDAAHNELVVFGGQAFLTPFPATNETWVYTNSNWQKLTPVHNPPARYGATLTYDPKIDRVVLFGGYSLPADVGALNDTWTFDGTDWTQITAGPVPGTRGNASATFDVATQSVLLFGGYRDTPPTNLNDTWTFNGSVWAQASPVHTPMARWGASLAYDGANNNSVLFGGNSGAGFINDTWTYNGSDWVQSFPTHSPSIRNAAAMTYDVGSGNVVLVGGTDSVPTYFNDQWTFNGVDWTSVPTGGPGGRKFGTMTYDEALNRVVLYGGTNVSVNLNDLQTYGQTPQLNEGYWFVASDGGIFTHGAAGYFGSQGATPLNKPIVGMAATPSGKGYWLVASDGGIFTHGDAGYFGSQGATLLTKPIVGMAATPSGMGYWLVASDGGIFTHGDAGFHGSEGGGPLNKPIVGMAATPTGNGYYLVASDGGIFTHGDANFHGSEGATILNQPIVGMALHG